MRLFYLKFDNVAFFMNLLSHHLHKYLLQFTDPEKVNILLADYLTSLKWISKEISKDQYFVLSVVN